ncbi:hypothetical protein KAFR_0H00940 [Kazachstania africana CBS 2517]|uniref:Inorganic phosphate transport protein PHO88 n=1 Tax=Kazachstania africana (strain ATCC 22294 / BCRC 22015 / CBS 2517 / CECT 1963 / NBRC 1671 / NRRL Y-8276) TaxID=1071382 RepID=H2AYU8_KAZAF|nr:hypothetical protein KAFR_0H00940 [Kazachstania africana CBS 2517]CCF59504.1 hypothetical protein KAFR_0H00940 [Kazachstania africana CBS 2517]
MNPQLVNILITLTMMLLSRFIDMEQPTIKFSIRILYTVSIAFALIAYYLTKRNIQKENNLQILKYVKSGSTIFEEKETLEVTTIKDYDLGEVNSSLKSLYSGAAFMLFMHLYMGYTNPLFMQFIPAVKGAIEHNEVKIHLFEKAPIGELKRPFKAAPMFGGMTSGPESKTDRKSIEELERAGNGGIKRD